MRVTEWTRSIDVFPPDFPRAAEIARLAGEVADQLPLEARARHITLAFDAPEFEGSGYWHLESVGPGGVHATLYGGPFDVLTPEPPGPQRDADTAVDRVGEIPPEHVDHMLLERWIHRNLLQLDDVLRGRVEPGAVPKDRAVGFQACWDVWTDGRLKTWRRPGVSLAERRRVFFRTFSTGGLLLPRHWDVFHRLWEGAYAGHRGLLDAVERLPRVGLRARAGRVLPDGPRMTT
jgi:hypothetical protein